MNPFSLQGQVALVTGANTGIGQAIAVAMAQAGAEVIAAGRRDCDQTLALMGSGRGLRLDFSDPMAARDVFAAERIDILVNNAGIIRRDDAVDFSEADWDAVMDVNLKAVFFTCQAFARAAIPRGRGKIVNIASLLSFQGGIRVPSYTASKHGVAGLTKLLANEWAAKGLNVNAIAPGLSRRTTPRPCAPTRTGRAPSSTASPPAAGAGPRISAKAPSIWRPPPRTMSTARS